jgi:hypothetical protein
MPGGVRSKQAIERMMIDAETVIFVIWLIAAFGILSWRTHA